MVKRVQSTDLLADSVLKRDVNTARLKDIYTIGKKLGNSICGDPMGYYELEDLEHDLDDVRFLEQYR
ncbi:hypothetical protein GUJ93_ZPchr0002g23082 [Zizania palustris]|uniref:Uncharacterized protein n=1 Tax=Zizania palustris TaxID=103762 RepID=A0A8J5VGT1_ZIZPA|nr:hypothetical protein GUJ93_ZPchr0002g23082 [Zizania palustris]